MGQNGTDGVGQVRRRVAPSNFWERVPFTDSQFLLVFLPVLLALYFFAASLAKRDPETGRREFGVANWIIVAGSVAFLVAGTGMLASVMLVAAAVIYLLGRVIERDELEPLTTPSALPEVAFALAVTLSVALFGVYKFRTPISDGVTPWLPALGAQTFAAPGLLAPLGLTFFVCHAVSYVVDLYRREATAPRNPVHSVLYLLFFPFMIAGPVVRYRDVSQHLARRQVGMAAFAYGVRRFTIGLAKVWLFANTLAGPAGVAFSAPAGELDAGLAWLGLVCFTLQIYFDLSGYADMALGLGRMVGFRLPENFNWPYAADTLHEFWRRWNISLVAWFGAYLTLPLEPSAPTAPARGRRHLFLLFLLIGVWHGPSWPVAIWGALNGTVAVLERARWGTTLARLPAPVRHLYLVLVVATGWVFFRADSVPAAMYFFQALVGLGAPASELAPLPLGADVWAALVFGACIAVPVVPAVSRWSVTVDAIATSLQMIVTTAAMFVWARVLGQVGRDNEHRDGSGDADSNAS